MRDWISVIVAVLGVLLVLAGSALIVMRALAVGERPAPAVPPADESPTADVSVLTPTPAPVRTRLVDAVKNPSPADRLIFWGIILLVLAAVAAGAISFSLGASGGAAPSAP
ncbi:hypothetical protein ACFFX1_44025 [Dactylosporangium sucinum]|uniref:Uncharacterized protein n=1 Tax=Dactylosporangium sucinum TaxID=1424081 RepID=A0A917WW70_9ACTN|nr:hypothetical protein [Dactylosporangium sucinum]GGM35394.1 hypothetical protein GCM10007977_041090 [Dactylosporangium sucinum]